MTGVVADGREARPASDRERRADWVHRLFQVKSVAIVGASERGALTRCLIENLERYGAGSQLHLVNPKGSSVFGMPTHTSIADIGEAPDLVFALVAAERVEAVIRSAAEAGSRVVAVATGGYAEAGVDGRRRQARLREIANEIDLPILGPNTLGYIAPHHGVGAWTGRVARQLQKGDIAFVAQSSGILNMVLELAAYRHLGVHSAVSVGNEAVVDLADVVGHLVHEPSVRVLALVLEGTVDPRALAQALRDARAAGKELLVLKFGNSEVGQHNIATHSGRLGTGRGAWSALFTKVRAAVVDDIDQFVNAAAAMSALAPAPAALERDPLLLTVSGGDCGLLADICEGIDLPLAQLSVESGTRMRTWDARLSERAPTNPLDFGSFQVSTDDARREIASVAMTDPAVGVVLLRLVLPWSFDEAVADRYRAMANVSRSAGVPLLAVTEAAEFVEEEWFAFFADLRVPLLVSYWPTLTAIKRIVTSARSHASNGPLRWRADLLPNEFSHSTPVTRVLPIDEAAQRLRSLGIPYVESGTAPTPQEAGALAAEIGFPVCVKAASVSILHKAQAGFVALDLGSSADVVATCNNWLEKTADQQLRDKMRFEVQRFVQGAGEVFVGMWRDAVMGPVLTLGRGGVDVEQLRDVTYLLPPVSTEEVRSALDLFGERLRIEHGAGITDLVDIVVKLGAMIRDDDEASLQQLDVNPILVTAHDAIVVDAVMVEDHHT